ncbi:MAG: ornithine cyclodeaminase [Gammaproteobacteria bacterium RIFCSPHIGHO2_12_FULL_45_9]|nr:MAG: ornithine cyclodeaminase [Gammaproteobacteria bacterium RIFCSPHIGHO2_12_FULL_45_9]
MRVVTVDDIRQLIRKVTLKTFFLRLADRLSQDFARWLEFQKNARLAAYVEGGVLELMPILDHDYFSYKYVNGHPLNPLINRQTVVAMGMLADVATGYPVLVSEMTILTALRTAAISAVASKHLARKNSRHFGIIGTGAQSEFQVAAHAALFPLETVYYYDLDAAAMEKFARNMEKIPYLKARCVPCENGEAVLLQSDIITTATARKMQAHVLSKDAVPAGIHINGIGGDSPGKTELDPAILESAKVVVEFWDQTQHEGEMQQLGGILPYAELWEMITGKKPGRVSDEEVTVFDSVGFALEDYSVLRLVHQLANEFHVGHQLDLIPEPPHPKDLFAVL